MKLRSLHATFFCYQQMSLEFTGNFMELFLCFGHDTLAIKYNANGRKKNPVHFRGKALYGPEFSGTQ